MIKMFFSEEELTALLSYKHPNYAEMRARNRSLTEPSRGGEQG
jgi:hypothetical protein